uniref:Uncharacterized protein n=1 Tax=Laticauda laticaudata TaxID=8630 RepID=A0A8C5RTC8_LATLA
MLSRLQELRKEEETLLRVKEALHDQLTRLKVRRERAGQPPPPPEDGGSLELRTCGRPHACRTPLAQPLSGEGDLPQGSPQWCPPPRLPTIVPKVLFFQEATGLSGFFLPFEDVSLLIPEASSALTSIPQS